MPNDPTDCVDGIGLELLEGHVEKGRYEYLTAETFPEPSRIELALWRRLAARAILDQNPDSDAYETWVVSSIEHSDGRKVFVAETRGGYSFTEISVRFIGAFLREAEAIDQLKLKAFISVADFEQRSTAEHEPVLRAALMKTPTARRRERARRVRMKRSRAPQFQSAPGAFAIP